MKTITSALLWSACLALAACTSGGNSGGDPTMDPGTGPGTDPGTDPGPGPGTTPGPGGTPADTDCTVDMGSGTCDSPIRISACTSTTLTVDNSALANVADPATCASGAAERNDVVIEYTPPAAGFLTVQTAGVAEGFDTVVFARSACPGDEASEVGCNDDGGEALGSKLELESVAAGVPLYIVVSGYGEDDLGEITVDLALGDGPPPEVAMCDAADVTEVTGGSATVSLDGMGAEHVRVPQSCSGACYDNEAGDAVLRYMPEADGVLTISADNPGTTEGSDTLLAVFSDCAGASSLAMACDDDSGETIPLSAVVTVPVTAGTPIYVGVDLCRGQTTDAMGMATAITADVEVTFTME